ncbi:MAG TPA: amidase [Acetobacteraceae bacterium]|jgi:aspartyl-tRNA(Asn)/glutamyl-tRNA(Gln) amidotransferase subunit A|nr:amidase [Acetobacteraceae bacterium]
MEEILTIAEASRLIAEKKLSPVELTQACLDRVTQLDDTLHAFILPTPDRAMADARAAETRVMEGKSLGPLDGIPIGHKDIYNTAGIRTTGHSKVLEHNVPTRDGTVVRKWAKAGTVLMGKLSTHEFAMGGPSFDVPWPPARNPWNPDHFTSGSSSGTGAAVAAGMVLGGTGSDTGGSIRGPAALCGITGIKPTYGLVSRAGVLPLSFSMDHAGPMAWTVEDCALLLQAMAGHDAEDPASVDRPVADFTTDIAKGVKGLRIGVVRHFFETDNPASPATLHGINHALDVFEHLGAEVSDVTLSPLADYHACGSIILSSEAYAIHEPWLKTRFNDYGELFRDRIALGAFIRGTDYVQALRRRRTLCLEVKSAMANFDLLVSASQPAEAPRITEVPKWGTMEKPSLTMPFNLTGYPAMTVPTGFGAGGLPVGMQLIAKPFQEPLLFQAAHAFEKAIGTRKRRPMPAMAEAA